MIPHALGTLLLGVVLQSALPAAQPPTDVVAQAQAMVASLSRGEFTALEERFTPEMKAAMPASRLEATWSMLVMKSGPHKSCGATPRVRNIADKRMVITACEFERATIDVQFAFDTAGRISGLVFRPVSSAPVPYSLPPYASPAAYVETELTIGSGEWILPATLTMPAGTGSVPAIVLVHGSGPGDRDSTVGASKPFKDLALGLASRGIAVLRYDKRTKVHAAKAGAIAGFTVREEVIDDALEAVRTVRTQPRIDGSRVFVLGHSLGGMLIPRIGKAEPTIAGLIVLGGPARPIQDLLTAQGEYLARVDGKVTTEEQQAIDAAAAIVDTIRGLKPNDAASGRLIAGAPASYWLDLRNYDPAAAATELKVPLLILQGDRDFQVQPEEFVRWKAVLGSRRNVTFQSYPALNHLFIAGTGPSLPTEYQVAGHVAEDVVRDIARWILSGVIATPRRP